MTPGTVRYAQGNMTLLIHRNYCKGCKICVADCPEKILALDPEAIAVVTEIGRCVFCGVCAVRCPDFAIALERPVSQWTGPIHDPGGMTCG
jgi:Pyruvate/2-oxoacid:ferredoxin oxidoreductase delta subunit